MVSLVLSPYSRPLRSLGPNPKNFPHWEEVVDTLLSRFNLVVKQEVYLYKGQPSSDRVHSKVQVLPFTSVHQLVSPILESTCWASVDNFLPHLCNLIKADPGVVVFSKSDPSIFGYHYNKNLHSLAPRFRPDQFNLWEQCQYDDAAFPLVQSVVDAITDIIQARRNRLST